MGLVENLKGKRVYFDTNIFIYIIEGSSQYKDSIITLTELITYREFEVYTSSITLTEVLPPLVQRGDKDIISNIVDFLKNKRYFHLTNADEEVCLQAGLLRGEFGMKTPDALHVATALHQGCHIFLTNDAGIRTPKTIQRVLLSEC